jgi:guanyl-specific ribonuclease Sa
MGDGAGEAFDLAEVLGGAADIGVAALAEGSAGAVDLANAAKAYSAALKSDDAAIARDEITVGCNSFVGSTPVLLADGSSKPIDEVKVGDKVADAEPGALIGARDEIHTVTAVHVTYDDHAYTDVTVDTGHGPATIVGTAYHLYWDATTRSWTPADRLRIGDHLQTSHGATVTIIALRDYTTTTVTYNLTIDTLHTYYVEAGNTPVLVHNCNSVAYGPPPENAKNAFDRVEAKGSPLPGYKGGSVFGNTGATGGQVLPEFDPAGDPITYREWDINPYTKSVDRGAQRLVTGSDGSAYYTGDHYTTFTQFR